jgi:hypothetical protein
MVGIRKVKEYKIFYNLKPKFGKYIVLRSYYNYIIYNTYLSIMIPYIHRI